ncbi:hypothetical protein Droror1_Dr00011805 [Drosera rotundifolia]
MDASGVALILIGPGTVEQAKAFSQQRKFEGGGLWGEAAGLEDASCELDPPPGFHKKYSELTGGDSRKNDQDRQTKMLKTTQQLDYGQRNEEANAFVSKSRADQSSSLFPLRKKSRMLHMILMHLLVFGEYLRSRDYLLGYCI